MTEIRIEGAQSYLIPLESIDLTYLSKYVQYPRAEKIPLWSKRSLDGESEYCEVKIVTQDVNVDCYFEEQSDTYKCHICNVHVPVMCSKEHNESGKHKTLKYIFDQVFERVSKQINSVTINNDKQLDKDEYYCAPCSKIVKKENTYRHKSSNYHIKSQEDTNRINEFYKIFKESNSDTDLDTESDLSTNNYYSSAEDILNDTANHIEKDVTNDNKCTNDDTNTISSIKNHAIQPNLNVETFKPNNNCEKKLSFEEYLKEVVKRYKLEVNLPFIDGEIIHIVNSSGLKVKVSWDQFHAYRHLPTEIYCQICDTFVSYAEQKKHEMSEIHARNILKPFNETFARPIDDVANHCIICNEAVNNSSSDHHLSKKHTKLLNDTKLTENYDKNTMSDENKIIKINNKNYFCDVCKLNLPVNKLDDHINDSGHVSRLSESTSVQRLVFCKLCNVNIPADKLEYHNAGTPHWSNAFNKICTGLSEGLQAFFSQDNTKTDNVSSENKKDTIKNDNAANTSLCDVIRYKAHPSRPFRITADTTKNIVTCLICDVDIANNEMFITEHEKSKNHSMSVQRLLDFHTIIKKTHNNYFCKCCNVKLPSFFIHIGLVKHTALLRIKYVLNRRSLHLYNYKLSVRNSDAIMYRELYKKLLSVNKIDKLMNSHFYCTICELNIPAGNEINHVLGVRHTEWLINEFEC